MKDSFYHRGNKGSTLLTWPWLAALGFLLCFYLSGCSSVPEPSLPYLQIQKSIEAGDPQAALRIYRDYLEQYPDTRADRLLLARLLVAAGFPQEARSELTLLIDESGPTVDVLLTLSYLERLAGNRDQEQRREPSNARRWCFPK